jgi:agmatinase
LHGGWADKGSIEFLPDRPFDEVIIERVSKLVSGGNKILALGGDHSVTYPIIRSVAKEYGQLTILHIDAHPDLYEDFDGNPHSHASPFARIMENHLAKRLVQVGIRTFNSHQRKQAERYGVEVIEMKHWRDDHLFSLAGPVYLSLDMDAIDPAFAPGVSHHEPGGFTSRQVLAILQNLNCELVGADLVEYNPTRDPSGITAMLAAKLFKEMLDAMLR